MVAAELKIRLPRTVVVFLWKRLVPHVFLGSVIGWFKPASQMTR
jgi:hypothetical protein